MDVDLEEVWVHDAAVPGDTVDRVDASGLAVAGLSLNLEFEVESVLKWSALTNDQ